MNSPTSLQEKSLTLRFFWKSQKHFPLRLRSDLNYSDAKTRLYSFQQIALKDAGLFPLAGMYLIRYSFRMVRRVIFYETASEACPVSKFLRKLNAGVRDEILASIRDVQEDEHPPADLFCKMVNTGGLWEIRTKFRGDIFRLLCFFDGFALVIAAHGFQKKTQKTPRQDIQTAEKRKKDYFRRKHDD